MGILSLFFGLFKSIFNLIAILIVIITILIYAPFLVQFEPHPYIAKFPAFEGPLAENNLLSNAQKLFVNQIHGPESIVADETGALYTGIVGGYLIKIQGDQYEPFVRIGDQPCSKHFDLKNCGRILGLKMDSKGIIYGIDAYYGLFSVDVKKKDVRRLLSSKRKVDGRSLVFLDDLTIVEGVGKSGGHVFYITDVSAKWALEDVLHVVGEHTTEGRVIKFDLNANEATVVMDSLSFPNGIETTDKKDAILVAELNERRILKHYIEGPKKGKTEYLITDLPGEPDNIRRSSDPKKETYWIAFGRATNHSGPLDYLSDKPLIRKVLFKLIHTVGSSFEYLGQKSNYLPLEEIGYQIRTINIVLDHIKERGLVIEIDSNGNILRALHSSDKSITLLSEVREVNENGKKVLYLGSVANNYLGKLIL